MKKNDNSWLEQYEIKKPDYDLVDRKHVGMDNVTYAPARYVKKEGFWKSKDIVNRFLGKNSVRLMFVGDITCFGKQFDAAKKVIGYDFSYVFDQVKTVFNQADLVVGNLETMIVPNAPYRSERLVSEQNYHCNAPIEFLDAVRKAGFDVLTNANNHDMDTGAVGIGETIDRIERFGFIHTGTFKSDKKRYEIIDVAGFKVAIVAFATEHNHKRCNLTKEGAEFLLNDYSYAKAEEIIREARKEGAEKVFVCIHWGQEHKLVQNAAQQEMAEKLAKLGYDCIIGSHPHVLQPFDLISTDDGREVPVFYSMGNFVSHNVNNQKARSIIACIDLTRDEGEVKMQCSYIPIYTSDTYGEKAYVVLPINADPVNAANIQKKKQIRDVIGERIQVAQGVEVNECVETPVETKTAAPRKKTSKPNPQTAKKLPIMYDDGKCRYSVYKEYAVLESVSPNCKATAYSIPAKILDVPVTGFAPEAFKGNLDVKKVNFTSSLKEIADGTFKDCKELEGFQLAGKNAAINREAFAGCEKLTAVVMRQGVRRIGSRAFADCTSLRSVKIPANVKQIADDAFEGCGNAVFYCDPDSYGLQYATEHGFKAVVMDLSR